VDAMNFLRNLIKTKKEQSASVSNEENKSHQETKKDIEIKKDQLSFKIDKEDLKIENGIMSLKLNITVDKNWILYAHDNSGEIGKPFGIKFFIIHNGEKKEIHSDNVLKGFKEESLTITKELETLDSKRNIDVKVFGPKTEIQIDIKDDQIKKDSKIIAEISGGICQKEAGGREPEICVPVNEEIELN